MSSEQGAARLKILLTHSPAARDLYYGPRALAGLRALGSVVLNEGPNSLEGEDLIAAAGDCGLVVSYRQSPAPAALFERLPRLIAFLRCAIDIRNVDVPAASKAGVLVTQASAGFVTAVAEQVFGFMIDLARAANDMKRAQMYVKRLLRMSDAGFIMRALESFASFLVPSAVAAEREPAARKPPRGMRPYDAEDYNLAYEVFLAGGNLQDAYRVADAAVQQVPGDMRWRERLAKFTRLFVGETPNAAHTKILNPEVLDFDEKVGLFRAWASAPLEIENRALGYKVTYFLKDFEATPTRIKYDGEPLFAPLQPGGPDEVAMWTAKRREAYLGSFRHFILAAMAGRLDEEGFHLYHRQLGGPLAGSMPMSGPAPGSGRFPLKADKLYRDGETPNEKVLDFKGYAEFVYEGEVEAEAFLRWAQRPGRPKFQTSMLLLEEGPTVVDYKGDTLDPYGVTFFGYLAFERIADEVPKEYCP